MKYTFNDFQQSAIGSFLAVVVFFGIRGANPFFFNPTYGLIISALIVYIYYKGFNQMKNRNTHFIINIIIAFIICSGMAYIFNLITYEQLLSKQVFGSLVVIGWWVAIPLSLIFDKFQLTNPLKRFYVRGK